MVNMEKKILSYEEFKEKINKFIEDEDYLNAHKMCDSYTEYACIYYCKH